MCNVTCVSAWRRIQKGRAYPTARLHGRLPLYEPEEDEAFAVKIKNENCTGREVECLCISTALLILERR